MWMFMLFEQVNKFIWVQFFNFNFGNGCLIDKSLNCASLNQTITENVLYKINKIICEKEKHEEKSNKKKIWEKRTNQNKNKKITDEQTENEKK